jgi:two-component system OmpR family sensor kinase/two-component system sensor histidine kinase QseC
LLAWLIALNLLALAATAWFSYLAYGRLVNNFMDDQMQLVAESHATHRRLPALKPVNSADALKRGDFIVQVWAADGSVQLASSWPGLAVPLQQEEGFSEFRTGPGAGGSWRIYTAAPEGIEGAPRVQVVQNDSFRRDRIVRRAILESLPILLLLPVTLLILLVIVAAASRSLRTVAHEVAAQDVDSPAELAVARVPEEIAPLVAAFNSLLGRLRAALSNQRRFMEDAAHELRTPMAAIGLQIENLRTHVSKGDAAERFAQLEGGVARAQHLIEQLLRMARQDAHVASPRSHVDVAALLCESVGQMMVLADRRAVDVGFEGRVAPQIVAPAIDLRSVFDNLIDNAVRHAPQGGVVDVRLHVVDGHAVVDVLDNGPGIPPEQLGRVFDRFYRVPGAPAGGSGLGLAIAQAAALRQGMRIELSNRQDGPGLLARVFLPVLTAG